MEPASHAEVDGSDSGLGGGLKPVRHRRGVTPFSTRKAREINMAQVARECARADGCVPPAGAFRPSLACGGGFASRAWNSRFDRFMTG